MAMLVIIGSLVAIGFSFMPWVRTHTAFDPSHRTQYANKPGSHVDYAQTGVGEKSVSTDDPKVRENIAHARDEHKHFYAADGWYVVAAAVVALIGGLLALFTGRATSRIGGVVAAIGGLAVAVIGLVDWKHIHDKVGQVNRRSAGVARPNGIDFHAWVAWGIWPVIVSGALVLAAGAVAAAKGN